MFYLFLQLPVTAGHSGINDTSWYQYADDEYAIPDKPFECKHCFYRSTTKNSLLRHIRKHTGERPYKCSFCNYAAIQSSDVQKHIRRRHMEKYYSHPI